MTKEDAIKVMFYVKNHFWNDTEVNSALDMAIEALQQPERKTGRWIFDKGLKLYLCSECGMKSLTYDDVYIYGMDLPNYCEDCGSKMEVQDAKI